MPVSILTILPILLPLAGSLANTFLPIRICHSSWFRLVCATLLLAVAGLLIKVPVLTTGAYTLSLSVDSLITLPPLVFLYTNTGVSIGLVFICSQLVSSLRSTSRDPLYRKESLKYAIVSCVLATCLAANITTVCVCWMAVSMILVVRRISSVAEATEQPVYWDLFSEIGSVVLVMIVAVLGMILQRFSTLGDITASPLMVTFLMMAALLRLGLFPLPGNHRLDWTDRMSALCSGTWLLLRIASLSTQSLPGWNWLVPVIAASSVVAAMLANLLGTRELCMRYLISSWVSAMVLAPLLVPVAGTGLAVLFLVNIVLVPTLLEHSGEGMSRIQAVLFRWLKIAGILAVMGLPFTLGYMCRWELQRVVGGIDQKITIILLTMSFTLVTLYFWRQLALELGKVMPQPRSASGLAAEQPVVNWVICGLGVFYVSVVLFIGFDPSSINLLLPVPLVLPSLRQSMAGGITTWIYLIATTLIIPLAGAFFLYHQRSLLVLSSPLLESMRLFASLSWLYLVLGILFSRISRLVELILNGIEGKYLLGWVLSWMVIVVAFLLGS
jgi:hypothetical protein